MTKRKLIRKILKGTVTLLIFCIIVAVVCHAVVKQTVSTSIYDKVAEVPYNKVALLLGTAPVTPTGEHNFYFDYRIDAATELYKAGKISLILVSGDNHKQGYDEPTWLKEALMAQGVPENAIVLDYAGFRTLDSVVRAKVVFGQDSITIVSQDFHNERAVYLARYYGMSAVGYNAKDVDVFTKKLKITILREYLARVKMFWDILTDKQPRFLGESIEM